MQVLPRENLSRGRWQHRSLRQTYAENRRDQTTNVQVTELTNAQGACAHCVCAACSENCSLPQKSKACGREFPGLCPSRLVQRHEQATLTDVKRHSTLAACIHVADKSLLGSVKT